MQIKKLYFELVQDGDLVDTISEIEDVVQEFMRISCLWEDLWVQNIEHIYRLVPERLGLLNKKITILKEKANLK